MTVRFTPISRRTIAGSIAAFCAALALGGNALANTWPEKTVTLVVPYSAGGSDGACDGAVGNRGEGCGHALSPSGCNERGVVCAPVGSWAAAIAVPGDQASRRSVRGHSCTRHRRCTAASACVAGTAPP